MHNFHLSRGKVKSLKVTYLLAPLVGLALLIISCSPPVPPATSSATPSSVATETLPATTKPVLPPPKPQLPPPPQVTPAPKTATLTPTVTPSVSPKPTITTTTPPPLTPAPTPVYVYTDNFTKPGGWWVVSNDKYQTSYPAPGQAPGYYVTIKSPNFALYELDKYFGETVNFIMQVDCTILSDLPGYYGVAFRMVEQTTNRYEFLISYQQGAYILRKRVDAASTVLIPWKVSSLLKKGANQTNRLMVEVHDTEFTLYANGFLLDKFTDKQDTLRTGVLRVMSVSGDQPNVPFVYNNFGMTSSQ